MAKLNQLSRFGRIINRLSGLQEYISSEELIASMCGIMLEEQAYTIRTLQRDINAIAEIFGIEIKNKRGRGYHIVNCLPEHGRFAGLLSDYEILSNMRDYPGVHEYIVPEQRQQIFSIEIRDVLLSIAQRKEVLFTYTSPHPEGGAKQYRAQPYFIKQSQGKWYLFALVNGSMCSFELGCFESFKISDSTFDRDSSITLTSALLICNIE